MFKMSFQATCYISELLTYDFFLKSGNVHPSACGCSDRDGSIEFCNHASLLRMRKMSECVTAQQAYGAEPPMNAQ